MRLEFEWGLILTPVLFKSTGVFVLDSCYNRFLGQSVTEGTFCRMLASAHVRKGLYPYKGCSLFPFKRIISVLSLRCHCLRGKTWHLGTFGMDG